MWSVGFTLNQMCFLYHMYPIGAIILGGKKSQNILSYIVELHSGSSRSNGSNKATFFEYLPRFFSKYMAYIISCKLHTPRKQTLIIISLLYNLLRTGILFVFLLQVKKLRHRQGKTLVQGHTAVK